MDSKQTALATIIILGGIGFLAVSCSDAPNSNDAHHGAVGGHKAAAHDSEDDHANSGHEPNHRSDAGPSHSTNHASDHSAAAGGDHGGEVSWAYAGDGAPHLWGGLKPGYETCAHGKNQSPIDFSNVMVASLPDITFDYKPSPLEIVNTGNTIQVNYAAGSSISMAGKKYELLHLDFHSPSEHTVGGKAYDMVAHFVHKAEDNQLAVVGVMFKAHKTVNTAMAKLWLNMPEKAGVTNSAHDLIIDASDLLPETLNYFNYPGSLTVPPCSENVNWIVMAEPNYVAAKQVEQFTKLFPVSVRPVQPLNDRVVKASN